MVVISIDSPAEALLFSFLFINALKRRRRNSPPCTCDVFLDNYGGSENASSDNDGPECSCRRLTTAWVLFISLPPHILQSQTLSSFRRHLKTH